MTEKNKEIPCQDEGRKKIISRRNFFNSIIGFWLAIPVLGSLYPLLQYLIPKDSGGKEGILTDAFGKPVPPSALKNPKGYVVGKSGRNKVIVFEFEGQYRALNAVCQHLGCLVKYFPNKKYIQCPCHSGTYDPVTGAVTSGPPPKGLTVYKVEISDEEVKII